MHTLSVPTLPTFAAQVYPNASGPTNELTLLLQTRQPGPATWPLLELRPLPSGVYLLQVRQGTNYQTLKLVRR